MVEAVMTQEELKRAVREIVKRSQTDPEFRALCLHAPDEALRLMTGKAVPADLKIRFRDSAADKTDAKGRS